MLLAKVPELEEQLEVDLEVDVVVVVVSDCCHPYPHQLVPTNRPRGPLV